jgi:hypothetical protein
MRQLFNEWQRYMQEQEVQPSTTINPLQVETKQQPYRRLSQILADQKQSFALEDDRRYPFPWNGRHYYCVPLIYPDIQSIDVQPLYPAVNRRYRSESLYRQYLRRSPWHSRLSSNPNTPPIQLRESDLISAIDSTIDLLKTTIEEIKLPSDEKNILESLRRVSTMARDMSSMNTASAASADTLTGVDGNISNSTNLTDFSTTNIATIDSVDVEDSS